MTVRRTRDRITPSLKRLLQTIEGAPQVAYDVFVETTPKRSGNARRNTVLRGTEIRADYPYAIPLDRGHSKQAPRGMTDPTLRFLKRHLRRNIRK